MADSGISLFLERIQQNPGDEKLVYRFLMLMAEEPDSEQKCSVLLLVAQTCSIAQPPIALQIVREVYRYARVHGWGDEMRRAAKISMACFKALGRMNAAKIIRIELDRIGADGKQQSPAVLAAVSPLGNAEENGMPSSPTPANPPKSSAKAAVAPAPGEMSALPLSSAFAGDKTDAAFLAAIVPSVDLEEEEPLSSSTPPNHGPDAQQVVSTAPQDGRVVNPPHEPDSSPSLDLADIPFPMEGDTQSRVDFANKNRLMTDAFWAKLYLAISTTRDRHDLVAQFPNKNGLLHFLVDHFRSMGVSLPQKTGQKLVALLHSDTDFDAPAFRDALTVCLWYGLDGSMVQKLLAAAGIAKAGSEYWGYYLDLLLLAQNARRAWYEIRRTIDEDSGESWALIAYSRLPSVCKKLKLHNFAWEPGWGIPALVQMLGRRPAPTMGGLFVGK